MTTRTAELTDQEQEKSWMRYLLPRLGDVLFIALFVGVIALGPRLMNMDGDLGRHLTIGGYILDSLTIPTQDIFSHTMSGLHLTPHEWLAQVVFALSYRLGGLDGVVLLCALVIAATFSLVFRQSLVRSKVILVSLGITILAAAAASVHWLARPHIFTLLFTVLWVGELEKWRRDASWRWWSLPLIMLVWVNTHGAFIIGILIWLIYLGGSILSGKGYLFSMNPDGGQGNYDSPKPARTWQLFLVGISVMLVTLINPAGWRVWATTFGFLQNQYLVSHTVEYQAPDFQNSSFWPFLVMICLSISLAALNKKKLSLIPLLLLISWTAFSLISARNIAVYAVIAAPILAGMSALILRDNEVFTRFVAYDGRLRSMDKRLAGYFWPLVFNIVLGFVMVSGSAQINDGTRNRFSENVFPVEAVDWIEEYPASDPIFNYFPWGGYLLYRTWPEQLVFIDGQTDFYGESLTRQYEKVITLADGWLAVLDEYRVGRVIMPADSALVKELSMRDGWELVYKDNTSAVLDASP
jgi:hypothetical protein